MKSAVIAVVAAKTYYGRGAVDFSNNDAAKVQNFEQPNPETKAEIANLAKKVGDSGAMHPHNKDLAGSDPVKAIHNHICHNVCHNMMNWDDDFLADCDSDYNVMTKCVQNMHHEINHCCGKDMHLSNDAKKEIIKGVMRNGHFKKSYHAVKCRAGKKNSEVTDVEADMAAAKNADQKKDKKKTEKKKTENKKSDKKQAAAVDATGASAANKDMAASNSRRWSHQNHNMRRSNNAWGTSKENMAEAQQPATFDMGAMQIPDEWMQEFQVQEESPAVKDVAQKKNKDQKEADKEAEKKEGEKKEQNKEAEQAAESKKVETATDKKTAETLLEVKSTEKAAEPTPAKEQAQAPPAQVLSDDDKTNNAACMSAAAAMAAIAFQFLY